jgi:sec-independent protein translocase protein TatC
MNSPDEPKGGAVSPGSVAPFSTTAGALAKIRARLGGNQLPPSPPPPGDGGDDEEDGMLRMSFMEHLQELRSRILRALAGLGVAFVLSLTFCSPLWDIVRQPAVYALNTLGVKPPVLHTLDPMEGFTVIWFKLPVLCAIFIASPWILYQIWAFISPGLYKRERRMASPFILTSAGLFITGGLFAYFVLFPYAIAFLLGIGFTNGVEPTVSISRYFDLFVNVILGVALVFELPVLIFFLTLLRILSPAFMLRHSRYAILVIFIVAAIVTPTPDAFNLMLFAVPMCMLFYVGIFASYLLVLHRENRRFPWRKTIITLVCVALLLLGVGLYMATAKYGFKLVPHWPFLIH